jgi:septum formation protein
MNFLHLASRSPRRRELLEQAGIPFRLLDVEVDESLAAPLRAELVAVYLSSKKAIAGANLLDKGWVLGADTLVVVDDQILGKPRNQKQAAVMLRMLSGRTHRVITGIALAEAETGRTFAQRDVTLVSMRTISDAEVLAYGESLEWEGKAGGYAIQETADRFVERLDGSYSNVVGLPIERLKLFLSDLGVPLGG